MSGDAFTMLLVMLTACSFGVLALPKTYLGLRLVCRGIGVAFAVIFILQGTLRLLIGFGPEWLRSVEERFLLTSMAFGLMMMIIGGLALWSTLALRRMPEESSPGQQS